MAENPEATKQHVCIVNLGHYRSGTMTLAEAARTLGLKIFSEFPTLTQDQYKAFLQDPTKAINNWFENDCGAQKIINMASEYDVICDGWITLLPFLPSSTLIDLEKEAWRRGIHLKFYASTRDVASTVRSELQHWTIHGLEKKCSLNATERQRLEHSLRERASEHQQRINHLRHKHNFLKVLQLKQEIHKTWSKILCVESRFSRKEWSDTLFRVGKQNANPPLPIEGILLTFRIGSERGVAEEKIASVMSLLDQIEEDSLCRYLLVLALDDDEQGSTYAKELITTLEHRVKDHDQLQSFHAITNPRRCEDQPFTICSVWNEMAILAWNEGADWVVFLGDDVQIECSFHYRALYRSFLEIAARLKVPFGFGCPWWNDQSFPGFPSFPCVGKAHLEMFAGLIPKHRRSEFVNQVRL